MDYWIREPALGGVSVIWREEVGWQIEGITNLEQNVVSLLLTTGSRRYYVVGAYVPPENAPTVYCIDQAL